MPVGDLITATWQVQWRNLLLGWPATSMTIADLTGWLEMPPSRSSVADRPSRHGGLPSLRRIGARIVEVELQLVADDPTALATLIDATAPGEDDGEEALVVWAGTDAPQMIWARCERRAVPTDHDMTVGDHRARLQYVASDPRRYSITEHTASIGLPPTVGSGGLGWPLDWPLDWGAVTAASRITISNAGNVPTWPVYSIAGPVDGPRITDPAAGLELRFDPTFSVPAGQTLSIDTDLRTVTMGGASYRPRLLGADWWPIPARGSLDLTFAASSAYDPATQLSATWRDAYM